MDENQQKHALVNKSRNKFNNKLKILRLSLKYRPEIMKLILKMRLCIRKRNRLIKTLKRKLEQIGQEIESNSELSNLEKSKSLQNDKENIVLAIKIKQHDKSTQTNDSTDSKVSDLNEKNTDLSSPRNEICKTDGDNVPQDNKKSDWVLSENGDSEKSIAEQVKEVAQSALEESGMVFVESAGMYYDYKTGYYYSPELGLYYHTDTGCYYYYSNDNKTFVFHSYPDKSAEVQKPVKIVKAKSKKHKQTTRPDDVENLTKSLSQDDGENQPKRRKMKHKGAKKDVKKETEDSSKQTLATEVSETEIKDAKDDQSGETEIKDAKNDQSGQETQEMQELEDGECSETESEASVADSDDSTSTATDDESVAKHHPPCMRVIVRETKLPKLKVGTLYLITKDGGTLGREGDNHAILINDHNVSRNHLDIKYDLEKSIYYAVDLGSKNGTILNGIRMSESQEISNPKEVVHGSTIQLGETKLLCHIHAGNDTCGHCEPGLIQETQEKDIKVAYTRTCSVQKQHQLELARLKNKYAPKPPLAIEEKPYNDRAQARREKVGSSHYAEKTQSSDINTFIAPENKGFKLLEKMGWSKGEGLGKDNQGDQEPIPLVSNEGKAGLGSGASPPAKPSGTIGPATLRLASKTKMLRPPAKAFQGADDDEEDENE